VTVTAEAAGVTSTRSTLATARGSGRTISTTVLADADGYLALRTKRPPTGRSGRDGLSDCPVTPDESPRVRLTAPGKDLIVRNGQFVLPFAIAADDDLGLASLRLLYTRISGSGENFTFTRRWKCPSRSRSPSESRMDSQRIVGAAPLKLEPGDMVIYRGVATDRRPGSPPAESDRFIVEIAAPGAMPGEGFCDDDRMDKYAISQQMVILNTER
jgi:hypothetical protein